MVTVFSCVERLIGFVYKVYLSRTIGPEGVGVYQISLSVLGLLMTVTSSGIPITISRMIIKHRASGLNKNSDSTVTAGMLLTLIASLPLTALIYIFGNKIFPLVFADNRCGQLLLIMLPGLAFTSIYAVLRGSFWANRDFLTYSIIELLEEAVMLIVGIIMIQMTTEMIIGIRRAGYAVLISYLFSFSAAMAVYFIKGGKLRSPKSELKPLFNSSAPITTMRVGSSAVNTLISVILPARLIIAGMTSAEAMSEFGKVFGMAIPMIFIPSTLIGSLALVLVPELSDNYYKNKFGTLKNNAEKAIKFSVFISCMIIPVFMAAGAEIGKIIYSDAATGIYVEKSAIIMLPMSLTMITTSMLNSLNKEKRTLLYYLAGASVMLLSIYFLPKYISVYALIIGFLLSFTITSVCNLILLNKTCREKPSYMKYMFFSVLIMLPSAVFGIFVKNIVSRYMGIIPETLIVVILTAAFNFILFKVFGMSDFRKLTS